MGRAAATLEATVAVSWASQDRVLFWARASTSRNCLSLADVLVLSSHMEANPVSILEALACGKPVVATRVGSIRRDVEDGANGYLVPAGDEAELAARLANLLEHARASPPDGPPAASWSSPIGRWSGWSTATRT